MKRVSYLALVLALGTVGSSQAQEVAQKAGVQQVKVDAAAQAIIDKVDKVVGADKLAKIKTLKTVTKVSVPAQKISLEQEVVSKGDMILTKVKMGNSTMLQGFDGKVAWAKDVMMGNRLLGEQEAFVLKMGSVSHTAQWYKEFDKVVLKGDTEFAGEDCHELVLSKKGMDDAIWYIGKDSHLPVGFTLVYKSPMGKMSSTTRFVKFKEDKAGFKFPSVLKIKAANSEMVAELKSLVVDQEIDDKVFARPAQ